MKKLPLLFLLLIATQFAWSQCTPASIPDSVALDIIPLPYVDTIAGSGIMDTVCVNTPFETVITLKASGDVTLPGIPLPVNVQGITLATEGAIANLPEGLTYECNPPNCDFAEGQVGCVLIKGTVTDESEVGVYDLKITGTVKSFLSVELTFPSEDLAAIPGNFFLHVNPEGSENCTLANNRSLTEIEDLTLTPNPLSNYAVLTINTTKAGYYQFNMVNLLGQQVRNQKIRLIEGKNEIEIDGTELANGAYLYSLTDGKNVASGKMMVKK